MSTSHAEAAAHVAAAAGHPDAATEAEAGEAAEAAAAAAGGLEARFDAAAAEQQESEPAAPASVARSAARPVEQEQEQPAVGAAEAAVAGQEEEEPAVPADPAAAAAQLLSPEAQRPVGKGDAARTTAGGSRRLSDVPTPNAMTEARALEVGDRGLLGRQPAAGSWAEPARRMMAAAA